MMTGITRVSKESIFSDLNNLAVVTVTSEKYQDCFGFTQEEVSRALKEYGLQEQEENVRDWYDGFTFGSRTGIYNPWSIINFLCERRFATYWSNTSSNEVVRRFIVEMDKGTARRETVSAWRFPTWRYARSSRRRSWSCLKKTSPRTGKC